MFKLFDNVRLDVFANMSSQYTRIVVSPDAYEHYVSPPLPGYPGTLYNSRNGEHFVKEKFVELLDHCMDPHFDEPHVMYLDEETHDQVLAMWFVHLFPKTSLEQFLELFFIQYMNREQSDPTFDWDSVRVRTKRLRQLMVSVERRDDLTKVIEKYRDRLPFFVRLVGYLADPEDDAVSVDEIRDVLKTTIGDNVLGLQSRLRQLYYTDHMNSIVGEMDTCTVDQGHPLDRLGVFKVLNREWRPEVLDQDLERFADQYAVDIDRAFHTVHGTVDRGSNVEEALVPLRLLQLEDHALKKAYVNAFTDVDRFGVLYPTRHMSVFQFSLFMWSLREYRAERPVVKPLWVN